MFKSVFAKYVTVIMSLFAFGFIILLAIITSVVNNSHYESRAEQLGNLGENAESFLESVLDGANSENFKGSFSEFRESHPQHLSQVFDALIASDPELTVFVSDSGGRIYYQKDKDIEAVSVKAMLPSSLMDCPKEQTGMMEIVKIEPLMQKEELTYVTSVSNKAGEVIGYVVVASPLSYRVPVMEGLRKTVVSSALLVLLAAMIAIYFISERVISPMREMSIAAKKFAKGDFRARVRVRGTDEVAELAIAFNNMADSLENFDKLRNSFIANVSHDLRTPMTTIIGFVDGIRDGIIPKEEQDHYLEVISMEVQRLSRLVNSLLDISRIQAGDRKFKPAPFDICEMGRLILISFEQKIDEKKLDVEFLCDRDRMMVFADHDAIYQIFYNICHNAIKFSREGGAFRIRISEKDKKIQIAIYNEGQGIPKEDLPYVFERFYKSDKSRGLDKTGVGLGMYISKSIIEAHGETIWVESEEGDYCEFFFTLKKAPRTKGGTGSDT